MDEEELMTYAEVAKLCGLRIGTLYALVHEHRIPHVRFGRRLVRFPRQAINRWVAEHLVLPH